MPHLTIQYSTNLGQFADMGEFCKIMAETLTAIEFFPTAGIRVRAQAQTHYAIADLNENNAFVDMVLRIGAGRSASQKSLAGDRLIKKGKEFFSKELASGYFALSLELVETTPPFSWKANDIHERMKKESIV